MGAFLVSCLFRSTDASCSLVLFTSELVGFVKGISPDLVQFDHAFNVVVWEATFGMIRSYHIGVFSKHRYVQHIHHHEMLKLKIPLPTKSKPPTR